LLKVLGGKHVTTLALLLILAQAAAQDEKALDKAATEASDAFKKAFKGTEAEKIAAIEQVASVQHSKTANRLAGVLEGNESARVRSAAVKALGRFSEQRKPAATVLASALPAHKGEPGLFSAICSAMEDLQEPSVIPTLVRFFDDKDEAIATRALEAAGKVGSSAAIDPLIAIVTHSEKIIKNASRQASTVVTNPNTGEQFVTPPETRARDRARVLMNAANHALKSLTNEPISTGEAWSAWWAKNKYTFDRK
jgi:HEAT repeat protein